MNSNIITKKYFSVITLLLFANLYSSAQITTSGEVVKSTEIKAVEEVNSEFFLSISPQFTGRTLISNDAPFGKELGVRESETGLWSNSFTAGLRSKMHKNLYLDFGLSYLTNKETNEFNRQDTTFNITRTYSHIGVPVKFAYITPGDLSFYASIGLTPKAFLNAKVEEIITANNLSSSNEFNESMGYTSFLLEATLNLGLRLKMNDSFGLFVHAEGRRQLISNYSNQNPYIRKAYAIGLNVGLFFPF